MNDKMILNDIKRHALTFTINDRQRTILDTEKYEWLVEKVTAYHMSKVTLQMGLDTCEALRSDLERENKRLLDYIDHLRHSMPINDALRVAEIITENNELKKQNERLIAMINRW